MKINKLAFAKLLICISIIINPSSANALEEIDITNIGLEQIEGGLEQIEEIIPKIENLTQNFQDIFTNFFNGNLDSLLDTITGAIGIINPALVGSIDDGSSYSNPETPEEVYWLERSKDTLRSKIGEEISQSVFSESGQELIAEEGLEVDNIVKNSILSSQQITDTAQQLTDIAKETALNVEDIVTIDESAQAAKASQDVLKALAEQNRHLGEISSSQSEQLAGLSRIGMEQSNQLLGISEQLSILNSKGDKIAVLLAAQNYLTAQVNNGLERQKEYAQYQDSLKTLRVGSVAQTMYIPGLFTTD